MSTDRAGYPLSCTSFSFPLLPLDRVLKLLRLLDLDLVDLCVAEGGREVRAGDIEADAERLAGAHRRLCAQVGLEVADVFAHLGASAFDRPVNTADERLRAANRTRLVRYLRYAAALGSPGLTISPGVRDRDSTRDDSACPLAWDRAIHELSWLVGQAQGLGVDVSVEPHLGSVADTVRLAELLCTSVPGLRLTLDHSHFVAAGTDAGDVHPLFRLARHAHLRQTKPGVLQCPTEEGVLDVPALLAQASGHGFDGSIALEFIHSPAWEMNRLDVLSETIRLRDRVRQDGPSP